MALTQEDMREAAQQLSHSGRGRQAMLGLLKWLEECGIGLDQHNQHAVFTLLEGVWGPYTSTARDEMRDALGE